MIQEKTQPPAEIPTSNGLAGVPERLRWTSERPAVKGWYFYQWNPCAAVQMYQIGPDITGRMFAWRAEYPRMISEMPGMWAGPLKLPLMPYETEKPEPRSRDDLRSQIAVWAQSLPEHPKWDWLREEMLAVANDEPANNEVCNRGSEETL